MQQPTETTPPQPALEAPANKRPYQTPEFTAFGSIAELTEGGCGPIPDTGGGSYLSELPC